MKKEIKLPRRARSVSNSAPQNGDQCDLSTLSNTFGFLIRACQLQCFRSFYQEFDDVGLTPAIHAALAIIEANPGVRQGFVASLLGYREPNMVRLVNELSEANLITRMPHETDRRATALQLTKDGKAFMKDVNVRAKKLDQQFTQTLSEDEREILMNLLRKVLMNSDILGEPLQFENS